VGIISMTCCFGATEAIFGWPPQFGQNSSSISIKPSSAARPRSSAALLADRR
jgi:hypothetical protein